MLNNSLHYYRNRLVPITVHLYYDGWRKRGSSTSRSASPNRLNESTATLIATPGTIDVHQASTQTERVSFNIVPRLGGLSDAMLSPRKLSAASARMAFPIWMLATTMIGAKTLGSTWRSMMRTEPLPIDSAASMYCCWRTESVAP